MGVLSERYSYMVLILKPLSPLFFQADVCHAYQLLRKGGIKDENIVVFMYDDIAFNEENPRPGVIINSPDGGDVYKGVPKVCQLSTYRTASYRCMLINLCTLIFTLPHGAFCHCRIILVMMLLWRTFLPLSLGIKLPSKGVAGRSWIVVPTIIFSSTTLIMVVQEF